MNVPQRQIARARRRLISQLGIDILGQATLIAFSVAVIGLVIPKLWHLPIESSTWTWGWMLAATFIAISTTICLTIWRRPSQLLAAVEVDRRFQLKERISSSMQLSEEDRNSWAGKALIADAELKSERIDVRDQFPIAPKKNFAWAILPIMLAIATILVPNVQPKSVTAQDKPKLDVTQIKKSTQPLIEQIRKKREEAEKDGLAEAAEMFKQLESELEKMQKDPKLDPKQALVQLNDLKKQMEDRRNDLGTGESLKKNLQENLKKMDAGPAEKLAKALQDGDMESASEEMEKMLEKMKSGEMSNEDKKQLAKQMEAIEKALQEAAGKHQQTKQKLEEQIKQAQMDGDSQKAAQLKKQLAEMQSMDEQMQELAKMENSIQEMKEALQSGDSQKACAACEKMLAQMEKMKAEMDQLSELEEMLDGLSDSKDAMQGKMPSKRRGKGDGMGDGQGEGDRPEEETDVDFVDSQVRDQMRQGETIARGKVSGANKKGVTKEEIKQAVLTANAEDEDSLEDVVLPKAQRDQMRAYFDSMRGDRKPATK